MDENEKPTVNKKAPSEKITDPQGERRNQQHLQWSWSVDRAVLQHADSDPPTVPDTGPSVEEIYARERLLSDWGALQVLLHSSAIFFSISDRKSVNAKLMKMILGAAAPSGGDLIWKRYDDKDFRVFNIGNLPKI